MKFICKLLLSIQLFTVISSIKNIHSIKKCDITKLSSLNLINNTLFRSSDNYIDYNSFISQVKKTNSFHNLKEINSLFTFIDNEHKGYILNNEYTQFESMYLIPFINCDKSKICKLTQSQCENCLNYTSFNTDKEINFYNYVIISKAISSFQQYQIKGALSDNVTFTKSFKTFFRKITLNESLLAYYSGINLFKRGTNKKITLSEYIFLVRTTNNFLELSSDDISNGFIILNNYVRDIEWVKYFINGNIIKYSYEDFLYVSFYYTLFTKYSKEHEYLIKENIYALFSDIYFPNDYKTYLSMSNYTNNNTINMFSFKSVSLFDNLENELINNNINPLISLIYDKVSKTDTDKLYFNEFVSMMQYFELYDHIYKVYYKSTKKMTSISSNEIGNILSNDTHHMLLPHPPLTKEEILSLSKIEILNSPSVDIFSFISYIASNNK